MPLEEESLRQNAKKLLYDLVSIYTPSGEERRAEEFFERVASNYGLKLEITKSYSYLIGNGNILLASHIDTIPGFIEPRIEENYIYGRGAVDAKGPLISMLLATILLAQEGINVTFAALSGEESTSSGAMELLERGVKYDAIVIGEPTSTYNVAIEYRGSYKIKVKCSATAEHSSSSLNNLILSTAERLLKISSLPTDYDKPVIVPTMIKGGEVHNASPSSVEVLFDIRYSQNVNEDSILEKFKQTFSECEMEIVDHSKPIKVSPNTGVVRALMRGLISQGIKAKLVRKNWTSDMNILQQITKNIAAYGPGDSKLEHTPYEKISVDELMIGVKTYYFAVKELLANNNLLLSRI